MYSSLIFRKIFCLILAGLFLNGCRSTQATTSLSPTITSNPLNPIPTEIKPIQPENRLPTSIPQVSGELGAEIDRYIRQNYPLFSGSVLVAKNSEILLTSGYKFSNWELEVPNDPTTIFRLASLTKPFTALAILMLAERGQLSVDDPICNYLADCPAAWQPITIHHLLTHTSAFRIIPAPAPNVAAMDTRWGDGLPIAWELPLEVLEERFSYSNSGYILGDREVVSQSSYEAFIATNILEPLGMQDSGYDHNTRILKNRASGYTINGQALENSSYIDVSNLYAAAGLYSTVEDLFRFTQSLYTEQMISSPQRERRCRLRLRLVHFRVIRASPGGA
jgi:CubicO group peptidase (beta-lactamase class C family)